MADVFTNDGGSNTSPYETWDKAATAFLTAVDFSSAGDRLVVGHDHTEDPAGNVTYNFPGIKTNPNTVISATSTAGGSTVTYNKADNVQIDNSSSPADIFFTGAANIYGLSMQMDDGGISQAVNTYLFFDDCEIEVVSASGGFFFGAEGGQVSIKCKNTNFNWSAGGAGARLRISEGALFEWRGGLISWTGTQPTALFDVQDAQGEFYISGVDLSAITSALFDVSSAAQMRAEMHHCLLNSGVALTTGVIADPNTAILMSGCDDTTGNDINRLEYVDFYGSTVSDDATFVDDIDKRSSDGATPISWKMVSTANATEFTEPTISPPIYAWVDSTGSKTFKLHGIWDSATDIQDDEIRIMVEFLEASADTDSAFSDDGPADITATPADQTTNSEGWTVSPSMTNENTFEISVTETVNRVGPVICWIELMKPSTTVFMNAKVEIT